MICDHGITEVVEFDSYEDQRYRNRRCKICGKFQEEIVTRFGIALGEWTTKQTNYHKASFPWPQ